MELRIRGRGRVVDEVDRALRDVGVEGVALDHVGRPVGDRSDQPAQDAPHVERLADSRRAAENHALPVRRLLEVGALVDALGQGQVDEHRDELGRDVLRRPERAVPRRLEPLLVERFHPREVPVAVQGEVAGRLGVQLRRRSRDVVRGRVQEARVVELERPGVAVDERQGRDDLVGLDDRALQLVRLAALAALAALERDAVVAQIAAQFLQSARTPPADGLAENPEDGRLGGVVHGLHVLAPAVAAQLVDEPDAEDLLPGHEALRSREADHAVVADDAAARVVGGRVPKAQALRAARERAFPAAGELVGHGLGDRLEADRRACFSIGDPQVLGGLGGPAQHHGMRQRQRVGLPPFAADLEIHGRLVAGNVVSAQPLARLQAVGQHLVEVLGVLHPGQSHGLLEAPDEAALEPAAVALGRERLDEVVRDVRRRRVRQQDFHLVVGDGQVVVRDVRRHGGRRVVLAFALALLRHAHLGVEPLDAGDERVARRGGRAPRFHLVLGLDLFGDREVLPLVPRGRHGDRRRRSGVRYGAHLQFP